MSGVQNRKVQNMEKPFPGCLGRMVNLFDLTSGVTGNKLLADKPHNNASSLLRTQSAFARMTTSLSGDHIEDKMIISDLRRTSSNKKVRGTPMKMLIDQEMLKEVESMHNPPNVVAKLMGLDALPQQQPDSSVQRSYTKESLGTPSKDWRQEDRFVEKGMLHEVQCTEQNELKNIHGKQSQKTTVVSDKQPQRGKHHENINAEKLSLIRQKFMEAKRLATNGKLRQSKEFQDVLEILSSNKDLFLKILEEPDSLFSQHIHSLQSTPPPETKRITVLKPSKMVDNGIFARPWKTSDKLQRASSGDQLPVWENSLSNQKFDDYPVQPTRIVVLKPSPGKTNDMKVMASPTSSSPSILQSVNAFEETEDDEVLVSREGAREIRQQMHENLMDSCREEFCASAFSNGYTGDESSFNKSENDYEPGNFSDGEVMSPSPRHSWDYINRVSPFSSSFSHASCSPESSVCREAKKRLSERWAMMSLNGCSQEERQTRSSSRTLGEMLAVSDVRKSCSSQKEGNLDEEASMDGSPKNLSRSKSVPVSSSVYEARLDSNVCEPEAGKIHCSKEPMKEKSTKSSLKGKVASLLFLKSKKSSKGKSRASQYNDESQSETSFSPMTSPGMFPDEACQTFNHRVYRECSISDLHGSSAEASTDLSTKGQKQRITSHELGLSVSKPKMPGIPSENQDQPSPISVLDPPFEEDDNAAWKSSSNIKAGSRVLLTSKQIDKSPPIESIARTLSWDDSCAELASPFPYSATTESGDTKQEEQDWLTSVHLLLSAAGLDDQMQSDTFLSKWHSLESPLDPSLRDMCANLNDKESLHEARRRQRRSYGKLVFDCVNAALVTATGYESDRHSMIRIRCRGCRGVSAGSAPLLVDLIIDQMKELLLGQMRCAPGDWGDNSLLVDNVVNEEVVGKGWVKLVKLEMNDLGQEIEGKLLEEIMEEAVNDLTR